MKIAVPVKFVPDLVEEITVDPSGVSLDTSWLRLVINEFDDHAVEQAILLKEKNGGQVSVLAAEAEGIDDFLFASAAKGADQLIKLTGDFSTANNHALARTFAEVLRELKPDLILTGVQAHNDLDGSIGPLLAEYLGMPYVGYVAGVTSTSDKVIARKEYSGGLVAEVEVNLPAVLGVQAAEKPPRYVAYSKIRQVMSTAKIEGRAIANLDVSGGIAISRLFQPEVAQKATMLEGSPIDIAEKLIGIIKELGTL